MALQPGCRDKLLRFIHYVCKTFTDNGFIYEIDDGTLMGIIKFNHVLPWEHDADVTVIADHLEIMRKVAPIWRKDNVEVRDYGVEPGMSNINLFKHGWKCELWIFKNSTLGPYTAPQTYVNIGGEWLGTVENPGEQMRKRYGQEIYRHAEHWSATGQSTSWYPYIAGKFPKCTIPGHQACLDRFQADGNIQFLGIL